MNHDEVNDSDDDFILEGLEQGHVSYIPIITIDPYTSSDDEYNMSAVSPLAPETVESLSPLSEVWGERDIMSRRFYIAPSPILLYNDSDSDQELTRFVYEMNRPPIQLYRPIMDEDVDGPLPDTLLSLDRSDISYHGHDPEF